VTQEKEEHLETRFAIDLCHRSDCAQPAHVISLRQQKIVLKGNSLSSERHVSLPFIPSDSPQQISCRINCCGETGTGRKLHGKNGNRFMKVLYKLIL